MNKSNVTKWAPGNLINSSFLNKSIAVIILNRPIYVPRQLFLNLWNNAELRLVVDGGANRWVKFINNKNYDEKIETPHILSGDFDSIADENMQYLKKLNCDIIHTPDQNETDFTKSLIILKSQVIEKNSPISTILVISESSGRLDHIMANINTLFKHVHMSNIPVIIMTSNSLCWLLSPGNHEIDIPQTLIQNKTWCGLVPVGNECIVSTKGLKWNLDNQKLNFGELVSTSNTYDGSKTIYVTTNNYLLWTMGIVNND